MTSADETVVDVIGRVLRPLVPALVPHSTLYGLAPTVGAARPGELDVWSLYTLLNNVAAALTLFTGKVAPKIIDDLRRALLVETSPRPTRVKVLVASDADVLLVSGEVQRLTKPFFGKSDVVRLATASSELARNIYMYAKKGEVNLQLAEALRWVTFEITAKDAGPGIPDIALILSGNYKSATGLGRGLVGTKSLLDSLEISSVMGVGTTARGAKRTRLL